MNKVELLNYLRTVKNITHVASTETVFKNNFPEEYKVFIEEFSDCNIEYSSFQQKLWHWLNNMLEIPRTRCGKQKTFKGIKYGGYFNHCSKRCELYKEDHMNSVKNTLIKKYGVEHISQIPEVKEKNRIIREQRTDEEKQQILQKMQQTTLERYGTTNAMKNKEVAVRARAISHLNEERRVESCRKTYFEKYGVDHPMKNKKYINEYRNKLIEIYGVDWISKIPEVKDKIKKSCIDKYGVEYHAQRKDVREKNSKNQKMARKRTILKHHPDIIEIKENTVLVKCKNICNNPDLCLHKYVFESPKGLYYNRDNNNIKQPCILKNKPGTYSEEQLDLYNFVLSFYKGPVSFNDRSVLPSGKEIDIYFPELKIGIEFNGDYWHFNPLYYPISNEEKWQCDMMKEYDANQQGISLYRIWESDWMYNTEYIKNKLQYIIENKLQKFSAYFYLKSFINELYVNYAENIFGQFEFDNLIVKYVNAYYYNKNTIDKSWFINSDKRIIYVYDYEIADNRKFEIIKSDIQYALNLTTQKIFARKCEIKEISNKESKPFLLENCLFGHRNATTTLGLFYNNELVMVYSFGNNYYGQKKDIEVIRVCTKKNTVVVGGSSKCLKYYIEKYKNQLEEKNLIFYVDKIHHTGESLEAKFEFIRHEYGTMNYWRVDYQDDNFYGETGKAFNRMPSKHKEIKQLIEEDILLEVLTQGVDVYKLKL